MLAPRKLLLVVTLFLVGSLVNSYALETAPFIKDSYLNLKQDAVQAQQDGRILMVIFEQEGCSYCAQMHKVNFADPETVALLTRHFDVIQLDIWGARELTDFSGNITTEKQFARDRKIQLTPMVGFFDAQGKEIFRITGYYKPPLFKTALQYVATAQYTKESFRDYAQKANRESAANDVANEAIFIKTTDLREAKSAAQAKNKGLALFFEQQKCEVCREMHQETFRDPRATEQLNRAYDVVRINLWGTTPLKDFDGVDTTEAQLGKSLAVAYTPTMIFYDPAGKEVFRYDSYRSPDSFVVLLGYLTTDAYRRYASFQDWLREEYVPRQKSAQRKRP